jgi:hypothetical protein
MKYCNLYKNPNPRDIAELNREIFLEFHFLRLLFMISYSAPKPAVFAKKEIKLNIKSEKENTNFAQ